jgi:hypothetical protein
VTRLVAYLVGVAAMGVIAQGTVGSTLHDVLWTARERTVPGEAQIVRETTTVTGATMTRAGAPGETAPARTMTTFLTVPGPTTTTTVPGPAVTTTMSDETETVSVPGPTLTATVPGPTTTTTVPGPATTTTVPGPVVTTTVQGPTETVTVTVSEDCDPPPKKPSNPPCPPHK